MQTVRLKDGIKALKGKNWEEFYHSLKPTVVSLFISIMMPIMFPPDADVSFNVAVTKLLLTYLMYDSLLLFVVKAVKLVVRIIYRGKFLLIKKCSSYHVLMDALMKWHFQVEGLYLP